jgi:hypothetical protein
MAWFRTFIRGENFQINDSGKVECLGFYTTRFIEVDVLEEAEDAAVALIRDDENLKNSVLNERDDPPMIYVEEISRVNECDVPSIAQGFTFFAVKK